MVFGRRKRAPSTTDFSSSVVSAEASFTRGEQGSATPPMSHTDSVAWSRKSVGKEEAKIEHEIAVLQGKIESLRQKKEELRAKEEMKRQLTLERPAPAARSVNKDVHGRLTISPELKKRCSMVQHQRTDEDALTFIFNEIAGPDRKIDRHEWVNLCQELGLNLEESELMRVFAMLDEDDSGTIELNEFLSGMEQFRFLRTVVQSYERKRDTLDEFAPSADYDYTKPTCENYSNPDKTLFFGKFKEIRAERDYSYHANYTKQRQLWQDHVMSATVTRSDPQPTPWIIYTCGPMGAGKGYALSWMSRHGYFPLEQIVHVDPDHFKQLMPEWDEYVKKSEMAGTLCHMESCLMAEIAQEVAMRKRQHVWVDGSLRDGKWYEKVFDDIRSRFPSYSIAIFYVYASEHVVRQRVDKRAKETGRSVPADLLRASLEAPDHSLGLLTAKVDFLARIRNDSKIPELVAYETVDRSGQFNVIKEHIARTHSPPNRFPQSLAPLYVLRTLITSEFFTTIDTVDKRNCLTYTISKKMLELEPTLKEYDSRVFARKARMSPREHITMGSKARAQMLIPEDAVTVSYCCPVLSPMMKPSAQPTHDELLSTLRSASPELDFLLLGGFVYFGLDEKVLAVTTLGGFALDMPESVESDVSTRSIMHFGPPIPIPDMALRSLSLQKRFQPVLIDRLKSCPIPPLFQAWVGPGERFGSERLARHGGFVFAFHHPETQRRQNQPEPICFPMLSS